MTSSNLPQNGAPQTDALTDLIRSEMQKILAAQPLQPDQIAPPVQSAPASIEVPVNGQTYKFDSPAQLGEAIQKVVQESQAAIQAAQAQAVQAAQLKPQAQEPPPGVNLETFVETLKQDPAEGIDLAMRTKYGVGFQDLVNAAQQMQQTQEVMVAGRFKELHPEFQPNPQNAAVLNQTAKYLGLPYTVDGLEAAYMMAVSRGAIRPDWTQVQGGQGGQQQPQQNQQQPPQHQGQGSISQYGLGGMAGRVAPPPSLGGRGGAEPPPDLIAMAHQMTAPQLEKFLQDNGHLFPGSQ